MILIPLVTVKDLYHFTLFSCHNSSFLLQGSGTIHLERINNRFDNLLIVLESAKPYQIYGPHSPVNKILMINHNIFSQEKCQSSTIIIPARLQPFNWLSWAPMAATRMPCPAASLPLCSAIAARLSGYIEILDMCI